jgi:hypothetical protein
MFHKLINYSCIDGGICIISCVVYLCDTGPYFHFKQSIEKNAKHPSSFASLQLFLLCKVLNYYEWTALASINVADP